MTQVAQGRPMSPMRSAVQVGEGMRGTDERDRADMRMLGQELPSGVQAYCPDMMGNSNLYMDPRMQYAQQMPFFYPYPGVQMQQPSMGYFDQSYNFAVDSGLGFDLGSFFFQRGYKEGIRTLDTGTLSD